MGTGSSIGRKHRLGVQSGQTYFYVAMAVDASGSQRLLNEVSAVIP